MKINLHIPAPISHDLPHQVRIGHLTAFIHRIWPIVINPPDMKISLRIPLYVKGFDHLPTQPYVEKALTGKRMRFIRIGEITIKKEGEPVCSKLSEWELLLH
jgi:hypothetical protein